MSKSFLASVAEHIIGKWGTNLSHLVIVLPGKRARLFMNDHLFRAARRPVWAPRYVTIDELFLEFSQLEKCQPIRAICRLYDIYQQELAKGGADPTHIMSIDKFYGWGEVMLADFDDVDKHLTDAHRLFTNARDLAQLDSTDFLEREQFEALKTFFNLLNVDDETQLKRHFLDLWNVMANIYDRFRQELASQGMGYTGMIYREVAEKAKRNELPVPEENQYAFVGFNVLDDAEVALFRELQSRGQATFYWDYDTYYFDPANKQKKHEAGIFMRQNMERFPNSLPTELFDNLQKPKKIRFLACTTDNAQMRYLPHWADKTLGETENESAIVLCNESLIRPLLSSLPGEDDKDLANEAGIEHIPNHVNITMGFPLSDTPIHGYLMALLDLQTYGWDSQLGILRKSFVKRVTDNPFWTGDDLSYQATSEELFRWLAQKMEQLSQTVNEQTVRDGKMRQLYTESIFQCYCTINQFRLLLSEEVINTLQRTTLYRLVRRALASVSVPFHGEEDKGLQVMGLLEARNLDFRNIVMTSVEEGFLPKADDDTSLIPYNLKAAFHLSTIERKTAVFAYYFYRTIQRADNITLLYNDNSSGTAQREMSRFLRQLQVETSLPITVERLEPELRTEKTVDTVIKKTDEIMDRMVSRFEVKPEGGHALSPSAITSYLKCPVSFFYQHVMGLEIPTSPQDGFTPLLFGNLFHDSAQLFYDHLVRLNKRDNIEAGDLEDFLKDNSLKPYVKLVFWLDYFKGEEYDAYRQYDKRKAIEEKFLNASSASQFATMVETLFADAEVKGEGRFSGMSFLMLNTIESLLKQLIEWDKAHTPFVLRGNEQSISDVIEITTSERTYKLKIGGRVDRMDVMKVDGEDTLRIVDYKTGTNHVGASGIPSVEAIFDASQYNKVHYYLQTFLYSAIIIKEKKESLPVCPALFYVREAHDANYSPYLSINKQRVTKFDDTRSNPFMAGLHQLLKEIFDPKVPFKPHEGNEADCATCSYRQLCNK